LAAGSALSLWHQKPARVRHFDQFGAGHLTVAEEGARQAHDGEKRQNPSSAGIDCLRMFIPMQYFLLTVIFRGDKMDEEHPELDDLQASYKVAVENWISAIRKEEALASVNHSVAEIDRWENASFDEDELRKVAKGEKAKYEDALRRKFFGF
jgi:hypothetical protein